MENRSDTIEEVISNINSQFDQLNDHRSKALEESEMFQQMFFPALEQERERLLEAYGPEDALVKSIENRLAFYPDFLQSLNLEIERTKIQRPNYEGGWRVHGFVLNEERKPLSKITVSLYDDNRNWIRDIGYTCTDEKGYFNIDVKTPGILETYKGVSVFLTATEENGQLLSRLSEPMQISSGKIDYQELISGEVPCGEPPGVWPGDGDKIEPEKIWVVSGRVVHKDSGEGIADLTVRLFDKENRFQGALRTINTDISGAFRFEFDIAKEPKLFEEKPGIHIQVTDSDGKSIYFSKRPVFPEVGKEKKSILKVNLLGLK